MRNIVLILTLSYLTCTFATCQDSDCVFDQETQTNDFLKETEYWSIHQWNDSTKTALIHISEYETLEIKRGGCVHFNYYVTLSYFDDSTDINDFEYWINEILNWTHKLNDFDNEFVDLLIKNGQPPELISENQIVWFFDQDKYCNAELWIEKKGEKVTISIGYYEC